MASKGASNDMFRPLLHRASSFLPKSRMFLPRVPYGQVKALAVVFALLTFALLSFMYRSHNAPPMYEYTEGRTSPWSNWNDTTPRPRPAEVAYLVNLAEKHGLSSEVEWSAQTVQPKYTAGKRLSMTESKLKFMPKNLVRARIEDKNLRLDPAQSLKLDMSRSPKTDEIDASVLLVGVSTTYSRVTYSDYAMIVDWTRWLTDGKRNSNGAKLVVALQGSSPKEVEHINYLLRQAGIDADVVAQDKDMDTGARYVDILSILMSQLSGDGTQRKFLALLNDDVFFPSTSKLLRRLAAFDAKKDLYIGMPSERYDWEFDKHTALTFGGEAILLSKSMAEKVVQLPCFKLDKRSGGPDEDNSWDGKLFHCISQNMEQMHLHVLPSYYAPQDHEAYGDLGDGNEGYAAGIQPLVLHNYRNFHRFEAGKGHLVTSVCGEDCFFQRFLFKDGWVLVNGYTISQYPDGVDTIPLKSPSKLATQTPPRDNEPLKIGDRLFIDNTDRTDDTRVVVWTGLRRTWTLLDSEIRENGEVWQAYVKRRRTIDPDEIDDRREGDKVHAEEEASDIDSIILLMWQP